MNKARIKRWGKRLALVLGSLLLLWLLVIGAVFIWLGTEPGRRTILSFAQSALLEQGLDLQFQSTRGQLPFSLKLSDVSLADIQGPWLELDELEVKISPWELFWFSLDVDQIYLGDLRVLRVPLLPPAEDQKSDTETTTFTGFFLPIRIEFSDITLRGASLNANVLAELLPERREEFLRLGDLEAFLQAKAVLLRGNILEPGNITAAADGTIRTAGGSEFLLELEAAAPQGDSSDILKLKLSLHEDMGGLLAAFTGFAEVPPYSLQIVSCTNLHDFHLNLEFDIPLGIHLSKLSAELDLRPLDQGAASGTDWLDKLMTLNWKADLLLQLTPGARLDDERSYLAEVPPEVLALLNEGLSLAIEASSQIEDQGSAISFDSFKLENGLLLAGMEDAKIYLPASSDGVLRLDFSGQLLAQIKDERFYKNFNVLYDDISLFGKSSLRLSSRAIVELAEDAPRVDFSLKGPLTVESRNPVFVTDNIEPLTVDLELDGVFAQDLKLDVARVSGLGLNLDAQSSLAFEPLLLTLDADLSGDRYGLWSDILYNFSSGIPALGFDAALTARLDLSGKNNGQEVWAQLSLSGSEFAWPAEELGKALGPYASLLAEFSGPLQSPYNIKILGASSGFEELEPATYVPGASLAGAKARASGELELSLFGIAPNKFMSAWSKAEQTRMLSLNGAVDFSMADAGLFLPEGSGLSVPIDGQASLEGVADGPATTMHMQAYLKEREGQGATSPLGGVSFQAGAYAYLDLLKGLNMNGQVTLGGEIGKGGPLFFQSYWKLEQPDNTGDLKFTANSLEGYFAGFELLGKAGLELAQTGGMPKLDGKIAAHFNDWKQLNYLLNYLDMGIPPMAGTPLDFSLEFAPGQGKDAPQTALAKLDLKRLHMLLPSMGAGVVPPVDEKAPLLGTPGLLIINGVEASVEVADLWNRIMLSAHAKSDSGSLDVEQWQSAALYADLLDQVGRVNLSVRADEDALKQVQTFASMMPDFTPETVEKLLGEDAQGAQFQRKELDAELLEQLESDDAARLKAGLLQSELAVLLGMFRLDPLTIRLDRASLYSTEFDTGFYLQKSAFLRVDDAIRVEGVDFGVLPGGHIKADAYFSPANSRALVNVQDFPLMLVRKFGNIPLPDGEVNITSSLEVGDGQLGGETILQAELRPEAIMGALGEEDAKPLLLTLKSSLARESREFNLPSKPGISHLAGSGHLKSGLPVSQGGSEMSFAFELPMYTTEQGIVLPEAQSPLGASFNWRGELANLWGLLPISDRYFNGTAKMDVAIGGTLDELKYTSNAYITKGRYEDLVLGILLSDMQLEAVANQDGHRILFSAKDSSDGSMNLDLLIKDGGIINTGLGGGLPYQEPEITGRGLIKHLAPLHRDDLYLRLSGTLDASGPLFSPLVKGDFEVEQGNFNLMASLGGGVTTLPVEEKNDGSEISKVKDSGPVLDITVNAPRRFFVRGAGMDSEWRGSAVLFDTFDHLIFNAEISPVRGYFDLLSRPFAFTSGQINIWGSNDFLDSSLDLLLTHNRNSLTAEVRASGSFKRPKVALSSKPPLPQDQIMSQVLFGKDVTQLSALEALQVANGVRQLMSIGQGGMDLMGEVRDILGIDTFRIGSSSTGSRGGSISGSPDASAFGLSGGANGQDTSTPTLEAGKYINDSVYIGVEQGTVENSTRVRVEVELRPNLTLQGSGGGDSSQVGLGWKRDY